MLTKTRKRKPVERLVTESPVFTIPRRLRRKDLSPSPVGRSLKRLLENPMEKEPKRTKLYHDETTIDEEELLLPNRDPHISNTKTIAQAFGEPGSNGKESTAAVLRQILGRLELLRQQHKRTERQIEYIIEESHSRAEFFLLREEANATQAEVEHNASISNELITNLKAVSTLLQRD